MSGSTEYAAISELARRILRSSGVNIVHNGILSSEIKELSHKLSDSAPKIIFGIKSKIIDTEDVFFEIEGSENGIISVSPPNSLDVVWVEKNEETWNNLTIKIIELGSAGYPGCIGCAGPAADEPWNEKRSRDEK